MNKNNLRDLIEKHYNNFTKNQKRIADFLIDSPDVQIDMTGKNLSKLLDISESTVVRFAQSIGLKGYPELSLLVNEHIKSTKTSIERLKLHTEDKKCENTSIISIDEEIDALKKLREHIFNEEIDKVVGELYKANNLYLLGCRTSHFIASYFNFYLRMLRDNVILLGEKETTIIEEMVDLKEGDIVFTISFPRYTRILIEFIKFAKERNAKVILLTDSENNSLVKYSDISLIVPNSILFFVDSLVVPMAVINSIIINFSLKNKQDTINSLTKMEDIWKKYNIFESNKKNVL